MVNMAEMADMADELRKKHVHLPCDVVMLLLNESKNMSIFDKYNI